MTAPFVSRRRIAFGDVDWARILYYPRLFHYCHQAFEEFMEAVAEMPYSRFLEERRLGFPAVHVEADYVRPLPYGVELALEIDVLEIGTKSLTLRYRGRTSADEQPRVQARITTVLVDMDSFESLAIPDWLRRGLESHRAEAKG